MLGFKECECSNNNSIIIIILYNYDERKQHGWEMSMFAGCSWPTLVVENLKSEQITELSLILSLSNEKECPKK